MKQQVILSEYSDELLLPGYELSWQEREYITKSSIIHESRPWERRFYFDELRSGLRIKTQSWVGVIELDRARIVIQPKFNQGFRSLMDMISFIEDLPYYHWQDTAGTIGHTNPLEILVRLFLKEVEKVLRVGPVKEYVTVSENLANLRGRVDFRENLQLNYNLPTKIYCQYDELVTDIKENQILLSILVKISSFQLQHKTRQKLNMLRSQVELLCHEYKGIEWPEFTYHRLNAHYERAHKIGHYLWQSFSVTTFFNSKKFYYSFLMDMNLLFEKFVAKLLFKYLPKEYKILAGKKITNSITMDGQSYRHMIPDIIVQNKVTDGMKVLDVKYKHYGNKRVENNDIYQLAYYAQYFKRDRERDFVSTIVYPRFWDDVELQDRIVSLNKLSSYPGVLNLKSVQIESILEDVKNREILKLKELVMGLIT